MLVLNPSRNIFKSQQSLPKEYPIELNIFHKSMLPSTSKREDGQGEGKTPLSTGSRLRLPREDGRGEGGTPLPTGSRVRLPRLPSVATVTALTGTPVLSGSQWHRGETAFCNKAARNKLLLLKSTDTRPTLCRASLVAHLVKSLPTMQETWVLSLGWENPLEKGMATHCSILAWEILMDRGAWWAIVYGVAKSQTQLSDFICRV